MSDSEFDVLDELYFVTSYSDLAKECEVDDHELVMILQRLYNKGWIKILWTVDEEVPEGSLDLASSYQSYYYLASKEGLLVHNRV